MKIKDVISALECFAPLPLQEDFDNAGLQVGLTEAEVSGVLLCLDVTEDIVREAKQKECNLIVSHHPLIFHKLRQVTDTDYVQRTVMLAVKNDITIVSMHTNLDACRGGVNHKIAEKLGLRNVRFTAPQMKAGVECCIGTIGELAMPMDAKCLIGKVKETFRCGAVITNPLLDRPIRKVAVCGGAGSSLLADAVNAGADAYVTGEMHYHEYFGYENRIQLIVIGHYESEQYTNEVLCDIIQNACSGVKCCLTDIITNPLRYW